MEFLLILLLAAVGFGLVIAPILILVKLAKLSGALQDAMLLLHKLDYRTRPAAAAQASGPESAAAATLSESEIAPETAAATRPPLPPTPPVLTTAAEDVIPLTHPRSTTAAAFPPQVRWAAAAHSEAVIQTPPESASPTPEPRPESAAPTPEKNAWEALLERQSVQINAKMDSLEKRTRELLTRIWNWICVGEEYRPTDVSREYAVATTWLIRLGVVILLCGIGFFLKYSIDRNWMQPAVRVSLMVLSGLGMIGFGVYGSRGKYRSFAIALAGAGFVTLYLSGMAAFKLYHLVGAFPAFGFMVAVTAAAMATALGVNALLPALLGCAGGYLTPVFINSGIYNPIGFFFYMTVLAAGTLFTSYYRNWLLLHWTALIFYAVLGLGAVAGGLDQAVYLPILGLMTVNFVLFGLLAISSVRRRDASILELLLLLGNVAFYFLAAVPGAISYYSEIKLAAAIPLFAAALALLEIGFVKKQTREPRPALLVFLLAQAAFALAMVIPLLLGNVWITTAWSILALVLTATAVRTGSRTLLVMAILLYLATLLRELVTRSGFAVDSTDYAVLLTSHLLTAGVYIVCLAGAALLLFNAPKTIFKSGGPTDGDHARTEGIGGLAMIFTAGAGGLFFLYSSYELMCGMKFFAPWFMDGVLTPWWSLLALALLPCLRKFRRNGWAIGAAALLLATGVWQCWQRPGTVFPPVGATYWFSLRYKLLTTGVYIVSLALAGWEFRRGGRSADWPESAQATLRKLSWMAFTAAGMLFFLNSSLDLYRFLNQFLPGFRHGGVSVWWSVFAFALLFWGIRGRIKALRIAGMLLFAGCAFKIFFIDLANLEQLWRIVAFAAIGVLTLIGAIMYIRFKDFFMTEPK